MNIEEQKKVFENYADSYINNADESKINGYIDKKNHSIFVMDEALLTDALFTNYNESFKNLLALESLFHDIGRFEQLKVTGTFNDNEIKNFFPKLEDHGDLGAEIIKQHELLKELNPNTSIYDEEIQKVIRQHSKLNPEILNLIMREYIESFRNYDLKDLFLSSKAEKEREVLSATNIAIIQDVDRLDIFRKIVKGIWVPLTTEEEIDPELFELFRKGKLPTMNEIKQMGKWNANVGHLVRMSFINQMNLVPTLMKIRNEGLIDKIYGIHGNSIVQPAYEIAKENLDRIIEESSDSVIVRR